jgi:uncharacterized membrane protein YeaQ/YmgE (transglycosylase-associated protein family)
MDFIQDVISAPFICIGWIIVGAIAGAVARQVTGARDQPFINDLILGLIGAFIGGIVASILGFSKPDGGVSLVIVNLLIAIVGAVILIALGRMLRGRA